jgi:DNA polymerase-3 subunit epsilon
MDIDHTTFVVTDTETTGTHRGARVIELAAVKMRGGKVIDTFEQIINPGRSIPGPITRLTGITTGMVFDKPPADTVIPRYLEFLGDGILVAHNLSFDRRMLNGELQRMDRPKLSQRTLCTLRLARRLLYELPSKSLAALVRHYELSSSNRHRAPGDARATAEVLERLLSHFRFARESSRLEDLLEFQYVQYRKTRNVPSNVERIRREILDDLPRSPGVYFMSDKKGSLLYIGKAKNIRDRVATYFTGLGAHGERLKKLVRAVHEVTWRTMDTELDALLEESRLIKAHRPRYNRRGRRYRSRPFLRLDGSSDRMELSVTTQICDDGAEYYGPVTPRRQALQLVELLSHLYGVDNATIECNAAPLVGHTVDVPVMESGRNDQPTKLRAFLRGSDRTVIERMEKAMYEASEELRFERARWFRDQVNGLERLFASLSWMRGPLHAYHAIVARTFDEARRLRLFIIRRGRIVHRGTVNHPFDPAVLAQHVHRSRPVDREPPARYADRAVEEMRILLHWLRTTEEEITQLHLPAGAGADEIAARLMRRLNGSRAA